MRAHSVTALLAIFAVTAERPVDACQLLPTDGQCRITVDSPVVTSGAPFEVSLTIVNYPVGPPLPPPHLDDRLFEVEVSGGNAEYQAPPGVQCKQRFQEADVPTADPGQFAVELDEAWSPHADQPTSFTQQVTLTPVAPKEAYAAMFRVTASGPGGPGRDCLVTTGCIRAVDDPGQEPYPYAQFLDPMRTGDAGSALPFQLRVLRNGYPAGIPLTVVVTPSNTSDPNDIFPIEPAELTGAGVTVTGDDEIVEFRCSTHYPCFVGVANAYHVTISDGPTVLWDSTATSLAALGYAVVDRAPLARVDLLRIQDDGDDGAISVGEHARIHLRLYARNPNVVEPMRDVRLAMQIPPELTVVDYTLHHHDNPMDAYDPTPAELEAFGAVDVSASVLIVDTTAVESRFVTYPTDPPAIFYDLFEVELTLETDADGIANPGDLAFVVRVTGNAAGNPRDEVSQPVVIPIGAGAGGAPNPIPLLLLARAGDDVRAVWADSPVDVDHAAADRYRLYRATDSVLAPYDLVDEVLDDAGPDNEAFDRDAIGDSRVAYYAVSAFNADGHSGDLP